MKRPLFVPSAGGLSALIGAFVLAIGLSVVHWTTRDSVDGWLGVRDCAGDAARDLLDNRSLECWFYVEHGAWRIRSALSAHHALVMHVEVTDPAAVGEVATAVVSQGKARFGEVLVYALPLTVPSAARQAKTGTTVVRVRWTPQEGFSTITYPKP